MGFSLFGHAEGLFQGKDSLVLTLCDGFVVRGAFASFYFSGCVKWGDCAAFHSCVRPPGACC